LNFILQLHITIVTLWCQLKNKKIAHYNKVGYKFGEWHDTGWWQLFLQEHIKEPREPLSIRDIEQAKLFEAFK